MHSAVLPPRKKALPTREIVCAKDIIKLYGCSERKAYRIIQDAKIKAGQLSGPLTVDQLSMYSGISRQLIKAVML